MTRSSQTIRNVATALLLVFLAQACVQLKSDNPPALPTARDIETAATSTATATTTATVTAAATTTATVTAAATTTAIATATVEVIVPTQTEIPPTVTPAPSVTITAIRGNLFIRRGPDMAFNPIGVLYKDTSAKAIARDVLSKWVQIEIPNSDQTGWVSIQTSYSKIEGDLENLPGFTTAEWPVPAYVLNCTHHRMYVPQIDMIIPSSFEVPDNEVWIYPGAYTVVDIDVSGDPEVLIFNIKEGEIIEIHEDALGEKRKCP